MSKQTKREIQFFKENGICPYVAECNDSNGCHGTAVEFCQCRARNIKPEDLNRAIEKEDEQKVKVQFT